MIQNLIATNIDEAIPTLMKRVLDGPERNSRNGRMRELTHVGITLTEPQDREIRSPHRKHNLAAQIAETMWVLAGRDDIEWLSRYLPRAADYSDDGIAWRGAYGKRLRHWKRGMETWDQLGNVVKLLQQDPDSRRAVLQIYEPNIDSHGGKDVPCNDWITLLSRDGTLDMHVAVRSNDLMWGWSGINAFEWSALLEILAAVLENEIGALHFSISSLHLYEPHWGRAENIMAEVRPRPNPTKIPFNLGDLPRSMDSVYSLVDQWFHIEEQIRNGTAGVHQAIREFPEPMMKSWIKVIQWWWTGDPDNLEALRGTRLFDSARVAVQPKTPAKHSEFVEYVTKLHDEKNAAYGDSWKKRGEMLGIMANIARKIDRLGSNSTQDESSADTAIDLLVYLAKYRWWLAFAGDAPKPSVNFTTVTTLEEGETAPPNALIQALGLGDQLSGLRQVGIEVTERYLTASFDSLEKLVATQDKERYQTVDGMLKAAFPLARTLWQIESWKAANEKRAWAGYDQ